MGGFEVTASSFHERPKRTRDVRLVAALVRSLTSKRARVVLAAVGWPACDRCVEADMGKVLVIGDVSGRLDRLRWSLSRVGGRGEPFLLPDNVIAVQVGDLVD